MVGRFRRHVFLTIILASIIVFLTGLILGRQIERAASDDISDFLRENELITESYLIEQALIKASGSEGCELAKLRIKELSDQLGMIGRRLSVEDADKMLGEKEFNLLKRRYHLMQVRTYFMYRQLAERCDIENDIVLFYYGADSGKSLEQGRILDRLVKEEGAIVFAVEYNYSRELGFVEAFYNITETPTMIIGFNKTFVGLTDYEGLSRTLS